VGQLGILARRLPGVPRDPALLYGVSYARELFDLHGEFREDLYIGEDTEFNGRLGETDAPIWAPHVQTIHLNPTSFTAMVKSQYARGRRSGLYWPQVQPRSLLRLVWTRFATIVRLAFRSVRGTELAWVICSWPRLLVCVWAYGPGVDAGRRDGMASRSTTVLD
jgi:hypothetical protein